MTESAPKKSVALFVTCMANTLRPQIGFAAVRLLEAAGCAVSVPRDQTCCGQPGYNSGDQQGAVAVAQQNIALLEPFEYIVIPSGSCTGMMVNHYPALLKDDETWLPRAQALAEKCFELTAFLVDVLKVDFSDRVSGAGEAVTYHDSCSCLRELGVTAAPRALLQQMGVPVAEMTGRDVCCGFGGTFAAKMSDISLAMADEKIGHAESTGAGTLVTADPGCLLHLDGRLARQGKHLQACHIAELLAARLDAGSGS